MKGVIWCNKIEDGNIELQRMIDNYERMSYTTVSQVISKNNSRVVFDNGDVWEVRHPSEDVRGVRCNISYIDRTIDRYTVDTLIRKTMILTPYTAYKYFYPASKQDLEVEI